MICGVVYREKISFRRCETREDAVAKAKEEWEARDSFLQKNIKIEAVVYEKGQDRVVLWSSEDAKEERC